MEVKYQDIEINPNFRRLEIETSVPELLREQVCDVEISSIINNPNTRFVVGQYSHSWLVRILLKEPVYLVSFPKLGGLGVRLDPEPDYNTNLPIHCLNSDIIKHLSLQVRGDYVWVYTGRSDNPRFHLCEEQWILESMLGDSSSKEMIEGLDMKRFLDYTEMDWEDLREGKVDLSLYIDCGIFNVVPYSEFDRKIDLMREFCRENGYFGFVYPILKKHPEPDFRLSVYGD